MGFMLLLALLQAPPQGPSAYYPMEEAASPSVNQAGTYSPGTWFGPARVNNAPPANTFIDQYSLNFDGVDDYVELANSAQLENIQENSYTLSAWYYPADIPAAGANEGNYAIIAKSGYHIGLRFNRAASGTTGSFAMDHWLTGEVNEAVGGVNTRAAAQWYHVAGVVDRGAGITRLYVNGAPDGTNTWTANTATREYGTTPWRIGSANPGVTYGNYRWAAKGWIDEARIYARALLPEEIQILALGVPRVATFTATAGVQQVALDWTPPAAPAGYTNYTYTITRSIDGGAFQPFANNVSGTSYVDTTATTTTGTGPTYTYQIVAISVATSGPLTSNSAVPSLPAPRTEDHDEGFLDGDCACGASTGGAPLAILLAAVALLLLRRP